MRFATFKYNGTTMLGEVASDRSTLTPVASGATLEERGVIEIIDNFPHGRLEDGAPLGLDEIELLAPVPRPRRNIFCVGKNYAAHVSEVARSGYDVNPGNDGEVPQDPVVFSKLFVEKATEDKRLEGPFGRGPGHDVLRPPESSRDLVVLPCALGLAQEVLVERDVHMDLGVIIEAAKVGFSRFEGVSAFDTPGRGQQ